MITIMIDQKRFLFIQPWNCHITINSLHAGYYFHNFFAENWAHFVERKTGDRGLLVSLAVGGFTVLCP